MIKELLISEVHISGSFHEDDDHFKAIACLYFDEISFSLNLISD